MFQKAKLGLADDILIPHFVLRSCPSFRVFYLMLDTITVHASLCLNTPTNRYLQVDSFSYRPGP